MNGSKEDTNAQEREIDTFLPKKTFFNLKPAISILYNVPITKGISITKKHL